MCQPAVLSFDLDAVPVSLVMSEPYDANGCKQTQWVWMRAASAETEEGTLRGLFLANHSQPCVRCLLDTLVLIKLWS